MPVLFVRNLRTSISRRLWLAVVAAGVVMLVFGEGVPASAQFMNRIGSAGGECLPIDAEGIEFVFGCRSALRAYTGVLLDAAGGIQGRCRRGRDSGMTPAISDWIAGMQASRRLGEPTCVHRLFEPGLRAEGPRSRMGRSGIFRSERAALVRGHLARIGLDRQIISAVNPAPCGPEARAPSWRTPEIDARPIFGVHLAH